ncbi:WhiB family transcriptional regulator [Streptomyces bauhiniae]|uniref:WhiB family transcriptional regulator n=1 Tax=Streptomyces bauhiniae TaxID=2340725 RepID=UPI00331CD725
MPDELMTLTETFTRFTQTIPRGAHLLWSGERDHADRPLLSFEGKKLSGHDAAFLMEYGRLPKGSAAATCPYGWCVEPGHQGETGGDGPHRIAQPVPVLPKPATPLEWRPRPTTVGIPVRDPELPWEDQAACSKDGAPKLDTFLATTKTAYKKATSFCLARCAVRTDCLEDALRREAKAERGDPSLGVRGGHTEAERRRIAAQRREEAKSGAEAGSS